jgi:MraZ protein
MNLFVSQFLNKVDKKGRISLPSLFRNALPKGSKSEIILYKSIKYEAIEGCSSDRINEIANRINTLDIFSDDQDDFSTSIFSEIIPTNLDAEGRFLISDNLKKHANINFEAKFIGQGHYFQIWEPGAALKRQKQSRERLIKDKKTLRSIIIREGDLNAK